MRTKQQTKKKTKCDPVQNLWAKYPPPWKVTIDGRHGTLRDIADDRICIFDAEVHGAYYIGLAAAVNVAAVAEPPIARLKGYRYYKLGDVIGDIQPGILPPVDEPSTPQEPPR